MVNTGMTKKLLLLRHAKSAWPEGVEDHERPLAPRGIKAAPVMAAYMQNQGLLPELALVSTALRTRSTWELVAPYLGACVMRQEAGLYEASATDILRVIQGTDDTTGTLMLVGHNPGLEILAAQLMLGGAPEAEAAMRKKFPTAALAVLSLDIASWAEADAQTAMLERFITPKMLK